MRNRGIVINAVCPGMVDTRSWHRASTFAIRNEIFSGGRARKITAKFAASALNVTRVLELRQNLLQKFDGEILS
jgi:NAD(P)-dependent dehydrogenase (short-subunit alcohol dehydrogenase family)